MNNQEKVPLVHLGEACNSIVHVRRNVVSRCIPELCGSARVSRTGKQEPMVA